MGPGVSGLSECRSDRSRALQEAQWCVAVIKNVKDKEIWTEQLKREKVSGLLCVVSAVSKQANG